MKNTQPLSACCDTHYACKEMIEKYGGKAKCCSCTGHNCDIATPKKDTDNQKQTEEEKEAFRDIQRKTWGIATPPTSGESWEDRFISEFCNDHDKVNGLRWLRGIFIEDIIKFIRSTIRAEREKILEACKLEMITDGHPDFFSVEYEWLKGYNKAVGRLNAIREKLSKNI